ncbi:MAG: prepilin-type N-terminal cleavage/methylation domain-containing protein [Bacilli bacterium]
MSNKNKKRHLKNAFTLIEIVAVIVIIGMFLTIMMPVVSRTILSSRLKFYDNQENTVLLSARNYFSEDRNKLPKDLGEKKTVTVSTLIQEGYINSIIDDRNRPCNYEQSYVEVTQIGKGDYQYYVRLVCNEYDTALSYTDWSDWQTEYPKGA